MPVKVRILVTVLLSQLFITILAMVLGPSILGWTVCLVGASVLLGVLYFHLHSSLFLPLERLRDTIQTVKMEGNLALRHAGSNGATGSTVKTFNELLDNFQSIVGKVMFNSARSQLLRNRWRVWHVKSPRDRKPSRMPPKRPARP